MGRAEGPRQYKFTAIFYTTNLSHIAHHFSDTSARSLEVVYTTKLAVPARFELATSRLGGARSIPLSYETVRSEGLEPPTLFVEGTRSCPLSYERNRRILTQDTSLSSARMVEPFPVFPSNAWNRAVKRLSKSGPVGLMRSMSR